MKQLNSIKKLCRNVIYMVILMASILFTGCKKNVDVPDKMYEVKFAINAISVPKPTSPTKKAISMSQFMADMSIDPTSVTNVRIGIDGTHDNPIISTILPYSISSGITGGVKLSTGDHNLVSMELLADVTPEGETTKQYQVLYSAVASGSTLSQFVNSTVPISFHIPLLGMVPVHVDVVALDDWTPSDFGWAMFNIGFTTVHPIYFYGATDAGSPSVMSMNVLSGSTVISSGVTNSNGLLKVLYPDVYSIDNSVEMYTFNLVKDGVSYTETFSVAQLLALPKDVNLLNVFGSGMMGFVQMLSVNLEIMNNFAPQHNLFASYVVKNATGNIVWTSGNMVQGGVAVQYPDGNDSDMITIILTFKGWNQGPGVWTDPQTMTAVVSVATLKANPNPVVDFGNNHNWLFN